MRLEQAQICKVSDIFYSPIGCLCIESDNQGITNIYPIENRSIIQSSEDHSDRAEVRRHLAIIEVTKDWLQQYFSGSKPLQCPPLHLGGTDFQRSVWNLLLQIPYGATTTYGNIAKQISPNMSAQAVGQAVGKNPIAIVVPCHRVVQSSGNLGGYAYGLNMKQALLELEKTTKY